MKSIFPIIVTLTASINSIICDREHKVHNIVLYPDRHSWCQTTAIKQVVAMPGYEPMTIDNNVCVGACYSYSIPRTQPAEPGELIGPYCDSCQPLETRCYHVTLHADTKNLEGPKTIQKRVQIITNCSCSSCSKAQNKDCEIIDQNTSELPTNLFSILHPDVGKNSSGESKPETFEDIPELLSLSPAINNNQNNSQFEMIIGDNEPGYEINAKMIRLLKTIQTGDAGIYNYDKGELNELLDTIEGVDHQLSDKNLMDFVNYVNVHNSEDLDLDLSKLKEVLTNFRRERELMEKHRNFGLGIDLEQLEDSNNAHINRDIDNLSKKYNLPKNFGIEGSHHGLGHHKGAHIGMGIKNGLENNLVDPETKIDEAKLAHHKTIEDNLPAKVGHHHLGEQQHIGRKLGHLITGPHGSLILAPDDIKVEEKLNLNSEEVRPNHEGLVLSYENHHHSHTKHHKNN